MFKKATKFIVKQMDPSKEFVPVESIAHNEHFRLLCLVKKKRKSKRIFHSHPYYEHTRFTLDDVLLPGKEHKSIESIHQDSSQFTLIKTRADKADGGFCVSCDPANVGLQGAARNYKGFSIKSQKKTVPQELLEAWKREREINMDHSFIRQLQRTHSKLYVVTEILEASEEAEYAKSIKAKGGFWAKIYAKFSAQGTSVKNEVIVIPKGCTLAFRTMQIHIRDGAWDLDIFPAKPVRKQAYVADDLSYFSRRNLIKRSYADPLQEKLGIVVTEVENRCQIFSKLSSDMLLTILNTIEAVMRDNNLLQELSQKMEEVAEQNDGYELKTQSPGLQALFSSLQHSPRDRLLQLAEGITYVLDALHELKDYQLLLLLESLEKKIVSQQLKLVENLLKHDLEKQMQPFHVDASLLSFPHKEEQKLTIALVEMSGVQLQEDGSALPRDQPFEDVAALFVALYTLNLLSASK